MAFYFSRSNSTMRRTEPAVWKTRRTITHEMKIQVLNAAEHNREEICRIHMVLNRPARACYDPTEYFIAWRDGVAVGCAGMRLWGDYGYFYGLAVVRSCQRLGIGSLLMNARLDAMRNQQAKYAIALAMFWNARFFRKHGFVPIKRSELPNSALYHCDLTNPLYKRSAVMIRPIENTKVQL